MPTLNTLYYRWTRCSDTLNMFQYTLLISSTTTSILMVLNQDAHHHLRIHHNHSKYHQESVSIKTDNVSGPVSISFLVISVYLVLDCYFQIVQHGLMFAQVPHGPALHTMIWRLTGASLLHHALLLLTLGPLITYHSLDHAITTLLLRNATT